MSITALKDCFGSNTQEEQERKQTKKKYQKENNMNG